jgi:hypothetical protein
MTGVGQGSFSLVILQMPGASWPATSLEGYLESHLVHDVLRVVAHRREVGTEQSNIALLRGHVWSQQKQMFAACCHCGHVSLTGPDACAALESCWAFPC